MDGGMETVLFFLLRRGYCSAFLFVVFIVFFLFFFTDFVSLLIALLNLLDENSSTRFQPLS